MSSFRQARAVKGVLHRCLVCHDWFATTTQLNEATEFTQALRVHFDYIRRRVIDEVVKFEWLLAEATKILVYGMHSCTLISTLFVYSTYPNNHNINNITSGVQYQATTASVNNLKVFPTLRGLRSLPLHLRVSIHMHASNTYTVIVCFLELLLMRVHTLRSNPKIQKPLTPKHC